MNEVILVYPPFGGVEYPAVGLSNFKSALEKNNIYTKVIYANLFFKDRISLKLYDYISNPFGNIAPRSLGEFVFASQAFPAESFKHKQLEEKFKRMGNINFPGNINIDRIIEVKNNTAPYLDEMVERILTEHPLIVGLNCTYHQICAAVSIANRIKKENPGILTVLGGFNCNSPMGEALAKITPSIDYIFSGEADDEFIQFAVNALEKKLPKTKMIHCHPIQNLDTLPYPDYSDYFEYIETYGFETDSPLNSVKVPFESSRGCWWGKCSFCGQNCIGVTYRRKSPKRIRNELAFLSGVYKQPIIFAADTALPPNAAYDTFEEFEKPDQLKHLVYQMRNNVSLQELKILKRKGINVCHPGTESLNDHFLKLIDKGTTAANNIRVLRDCRTLDTINFWNFLYGMPGEEETDYESMLELIPFIHHLRPPSHEHRINIMRYSPIAENPTKFKIKKLVVKDFSEDIFPGDEDIVKDLALYFAGDYPIAFNNPDLKKRFFQALSHWKSLWKTNPPFLHFQQTGDGIFIVEDTRQISISKQRIINLNHYTILKKLQEPLTDKEMKDWLNDHHLLNQFEELEKWKYIIKIDEQWLSLVTGCEK